MIDRALTRSPIDGEERTIHLLPPHHRKTVCAFVAADGGNVLYAAPPGELAGRFGTGTADELDGRRAVYRHATATWELLKVA